MAPSATTPGSTPGTGDDPTILSLRKTLTSEQTPLARRFRALFSLKHYASLDPPTVQTVPAIEAIAAAFPTPSSLLKHELAYCLGQTRNDAAIPFLRARLKDAAEDAICRHEAAEALGALGDEGSLALLKRCRDDEREEVVVRETCDIAVARLEWERSRAAETERLHKRCVYPDGIFEAVVKLIGLMIYSDFTSIDPAPPLPQDSEKPSIPELEQTMLDTTFPLFQRYRAMFSLRDLCSPPDLPTAVPAVQALAKGLKDPSALFRHEVAFVFGQLSHPASIPALYDTLQDQREVGMVRHEAAEALGSLGDEDGVEDMLKKFLDDEEEVVRESIVVALDMAEFERNGEAEYALAPEVEDSSAMEVAAAA
ncbi:MAG: deoxyhypusine hydroxylase [Piccolia ochrophora]|nr:MAG: deoxyhypusine hydroxylase [Piccolia ochrophora]